MCSERLQDQNLSIQKYFIQQKQHIKPRMKSCIATSGDLRLQADEELFAMKVRKAPQILIHRYEVAMV